VEGPILVTGGAGFIGSHVADALLARGHEVRVLDAIHPGVHAVRPTYLDDRVELVQGDIRDREGVRRAVRGVAAVSHQASVVGLESSFTEAPAYVSSNDLGTGTLLAGLAETGFAGPLVLGSSMVIYGEGGYACAEHGFVRPLPRAQEDLLTGRFEPGCPDCGRELTPRPLPESAPPDPRSVYAATKLAQERLCALLARERGLRHIALRYHNVYGPRMPRETPYAGVASIFMSALAAGRPPSVFEDGRQLRDFVHVRDVARANVIALLEGPAGGVYNVGSGRPRSVGEMARELAAARGPGAPSPIITGEFRLGDVRHVFADVTRAAAQLGFRARIDFAEGMRELAHAELREPPRGSPDGVEEELHGDTLGDEQREHDPQPSGRQ
jgi:dTDP-L-rhamnose 4-epimerase